MAPSPSARCGEGSGSWGLRYLLYVFRLGATDPHAVGERPGSACAIEVEGLKRRRSGFRVSGFGFRVSGFGFRASGLGLGFRFRVGGLGWGGGGWFRL